MAEELKALIDRIQEEGVKAAQEKGASIEAVARGRADGIVKAAEREAAALLEEARSRIARLEEGSKSSVKQAARDTMLGLRKEIAATLDRIIAAHVHHALGADELGRILASVVKGCSGAAHDKVVVSVKKEDLEKIEKALFAELGAELKKGVSFRAGADIKGGFLISYDGGKSHFDFTDKALADYVASLVKPQLGALIKEATA